MTQCTSLQDKYGVRCNLGQFHFQAHIWQGEMFGTENTVVVWRDEESREHMTHERSFFALAEDMTKNRYPTPQMQTMIADLLIRLRSKEKK